MSSEAEAMQTDMLARIEDEVRLAIAEQHEYAALGPADRWRWRREHGGPPAGWRTMTWRNRRRIRREGETG